MLPADTAVPASRMHPLIQLLGVSKSFGGTAALHPTDLAFPPGLTTALIGPSGCGKSTLLRFIIGLLKPDTGKVTFDGPGSDGDERPTSAPARRLRHPGGRTLSAFDGPRQCSPSLAPSRPPGFQNGGATRANFARCRGSRGSDSIVIPSSFPADNASASA